MTKITTKVEEVDKKFVEKMLDSKFCLSDYIINGANDFDWIAGEKVKEFIKRLKDEIVNEADWKDVDKLAGKKLI